MLMVAMVSAACGTTGGQVKNSTELETVYVVPPYPRQAWERCLEGWVLVQFTVTAKGTVEDVEVVDSQPPGVFDRAAVAAAKRFRFTPGMQDGVAVPSYNVQHTLSWEFEEPPSHCERR